MKLILVSDLHGQIKTLGYLEKILTHEQPDGVIISGDISAEGKIDFVKKLFELIDNFGVNAFLICGNADTGEAQNLIDESRHSVNQVCREGICGLCDHEEFLIDSKNIGKRIFVSHRPPRASLLKTELENSPSYHISGHLHSLAFVKKYPATIHIQVPTLQDGKYGLFDTDKGEVKFSSLG